MVHTKLRMASIVPHTRYGLCMYVDRIFIIIKNMTTVGNFRFILHQFWNLYVHLQKLCTKTCH